MSNPEEQPKWQIWYECKYHGQFDKLQDEVPTEHTIAWCPTCESDIYPSHASDGETELSF